MAVNRTNNHRLSKPFIYEVRYFGFPNPFKWKAHNVTFYDNPKRKVIIYKTKSGWIIFNKDTGKTNGRKVYKAGWIGYSDSEIRNALNSY